MEWIDETPGRLSSPNSVLLAQKHKNYSIYEAIDVLANCPQLHSLFLNLTTEEEVLKKFQALQFLNPKLLQNIPDRWDDHEA